MENFMTPIPCNE